MKINKIKQQNKNEKNGDIIGYTKNRAD